MKKSNKKPAVLVLYAIAILLGIYTIVTMYSSYTYISGLVSQGLVISDELLNIVTYFVGNSVPYLFYAIVIWAIGYFINKLDYKVDEVNVNNSKELEAEIVAPINEQVVAIDDTK